MYHSLLGFALLAQQGLAAYCPPTGEVLPRPKVTKDLDLSHLTKILDGIAEDSSALGWNSTTTSFSIKATSLEDDVFSYYHTAPKTNETGSQEVDGDTVFRIASVTKLFTVLAVMLEEGLDLDDKIGKYVEELDGLEEWEDVTLRLLTSQMAGAPRDGFAGDYSDREDLLVKLGYPPLDDDEIPECGSSPFIEECPRKEVIQEQIIDWGFVGKVADRAAYSNMAYMLLGYALEKVTGSSYEDVIRQKTIEPLGLSHTTFEDPSLDDAIIPVGTPWFGGDFGDFKMTAGLYSTANDMTKFARAILNSELLTPAETRAWLKPSVFTSSLTTAVGAPWEILRPTHLTPHPRPVDHYTKSGDVLGYSAHLLLIPEFGLGVTFHVASTEAYGPINSLIDVVQEALIPPFDDMARTQAYETYGGEYVAKYNEDPATLSLTLDEGPGLKIANWTNRGKDMLQSFHEINGMTDARIYPSGIDDRWRIVFSDGATEQAGEKPSVIGESCKSWMEIDHYNYGKVPVDVFEFDINDKGEVQGVEHPGFRTELMKVLEATSRERELK